MEENESPIFFKDAKKWQRKLLYNTKPDKTNYENEYEIKLFELMTLRYLNPEFEEFLIACNVRGCFKFGDLIMCQKTNGSKSCMVYLVQYQLDKISTNSNDFFDNSSNFLLNKYEYSYKKLLDTKFKSLTELFSDLNITSENVKLILYTNKFDEVANCKFLKKSNIRESFLTTDGNIYTFDENNVTLQKYSKQFLSKLYLVVEQSDAIDVLLNNEINKFVFNSQNNLANNFFQFIKFWANGKLGGHYVLTKNQIVTELTELIFDSYFFKFCHLTNECKDVLCNNEVFNEIVAEFDIVSMSKCDKPIIMFLRTFLNRWLYLKLSDISTIFPTIHIHLKHEITTVRINNETRIYKALWRLGYLPLVLFVENHSECLHVARILNSVKINCKFIILGEDASLDEIKLSNFNVLNNFSQLNETLQKSILDCTVSFQSRLCKLREILEDVFSVKDLISSNDIIKILNGTFTIGEAVEPLPQQLITQKLSKVFLTADIFKVLNNIFFVICNNRNLFKNFLRKQKIDYLLLNDFDDISETHLKSKKCLIIFRNNIDVALPENKSTYNVHTLMFHSRENRIEWLKSFGKIKHIIMYLDKNTINYNDNWRSLNDVSVNLPNLLNIISSETGVGKSTAMNKISLETSVDKWVLKINCKDEKTYFFELVDFQNEPSVCIERFKTMHNSNTPLSKTLFQHFFDKQRILWLFDGFHEIRLKYISSVKKLIHALMAANYSIWITTAPVAQIDLEQEFNSFSRTLNLFPKGQKQIGEVRHSKTVNISPTTEVEETTLHEAVRNGNRKMVEMLLSKENNYLINSTQEAALHTAVQNNKKEIVKLLLNYGAQIHAVDRDGFTALHHAAKKSNTTIIKLLLANEANIQATTDSGETALHCAVERGNVKTVQLLLTNGADVNAVTKVGETPLHYGRKRATNDIIKLLLAYNVNSEVLIKNKDAILQHTVIFQNNDIIPNSKHPKAMNIKAIDNIRETAEHNAIILKNIVTLLMNFGKNFYSGNKYDQDLLYLSATYYNNKIIELFLDKGIDITNEYLLHKVLQSNSTEVEEIIMSNRINVNTKNTLQQTSLYHATTSGTTKLTELNKKIGFHASDDTAENALYKAINSGIAKIANIVLSKGIHVDITNFFGQIALPLAATFKNPKRNQMLLPAYININAYDTNGENALHKVAQSGNTEIAKMLVSKGINVNRTNYYGQTALHQAVIYDNIEIVKLLLSTENDINTNDVDYENALHKVAQSGNMKIANMFNQVLLPTYININAYDTNGENALHKVAQSGNMEIAKILLSKGINVNRTNYSGQTALHQAVIYDNIEIVKLLLSTENDINTNDVDYENALHKVAQSGNTEIANMLLMSRGINVNKKNYFGETALHQAITYNTEIVELLLSTENDINASDVDYENSLHKVAQSGNMEIANMLLMSKGINVNTKNYFGQTALHQAVTYNNTKTVTVHRY